MNRLASASLGDGKCPVCGHVGKIKTTTAGWAYINCAHVGDGGCQTQVMARSEKGSLKLCEGMVKWYDGMHEKLLGDAARKPTPAPAKKPASSPAARQTSKSPSRKAASPPAPKPEEEEKSWLDRLIE